MLKSCRSSPSNNYQTDKDFAKKIDLKNIKFPVQVKHIHKIEKMNSISISVFGYENKEKCSYQRFQYIQVE